MRSRALLASALLTGIFLMPVVIRELHIKVNVKDPVARDAP